MSSRFTGDAHMRFSGNIPACHKYISFARSLMGIAIGINKNRNSFVWSRIIDGVKYRFQKASDGDYFIYIHAPFIDIIQKYGLSFTDTVDIGQGVRYRVYQPVNNEFRPFFSRGLVDSYLSYDDTFAAHHKSSLLGLDGNPIILGFNTAGSVYTNGNIGSDIFYQHSTVISGFSGNGISIINNPDFNVIPEAKEFLFIKPKIPIAPIDEGGIIIEFYKLEVDKKELRNNTLLDSNFTLYDTITVGAGKSYPPQLTGEAWLMHNIRFSRDGTEGAFLVYSPDYEENAGVPPDMAPSGHGGIVLITVSTNGISASGSASFKDYTDNFFEYNNESLYQEEKRLLPSGDTVICGDNSSTKTHYYYQVSRFSCHIDCDPPYEDEGRINEDYDRDLDGTWHAEVVGCRYTFPEKSYTVPIAVDFNNSGIVFLERKLTFWLEKQTEKRDRTSFMNSHEYIYRGSDYCDNADDWQSIWNNTRGSTETKEEHLHIKEQSVYLYNGKEISGLKDGYTYDETYNYDTTFSQSSTVHIDGAWIEPYDITASIMWNRDTGFSYTIFPFMDLSEGVVIAQLYSAIRTNSYVHSGSGSAEEDPIPWVQTITVQSEDTLIDQSGNIIKHNTYIPSTETTNGGNTAGDFFVQLAFYTTESKVTISGLPESYICEPNCDDGIPDCPGDIVEWYYSMPGQPIPVVSDNGPSAYNITKCPAFDYDDVWALIVQGSSNVYSSNYYKTGREASSEAKIVWLYTGYLLRAPSIRVQGIESQEPLLSFTNKASALNNDYLMYTKIHGVDDYILNGNILSAEQRIKHNLPDFSEIVRIYTA